MICSPAAFAAAHELLDRHADHAGEYALEIYLTAPQLPHPDQERLGIRHYRLSAEGRKQARAIGLHGPDLEARVARMVRHAVPTSGSGASSCGSRTTR